ncbi:MAG: hypothetical protein ACTSR2_06385 [Candidatus Hodarchaeales archaeon]
MYNPLEIVATLVENNFAVGRNNSSAPVKGGKRPHIIFDWDGNMDKPLPSLEFRFDSGNYTIRNLNSNFRYNKDEIRIVVRSKIQHECWLIGNHIIDDILIPETTNFTTLTDYPNMEYNFLEVLSNRDVREYAEDELYWRMDILVILHRPKVYTLN